MKKMKIGYHEFMAHIKQEKLTFAIFLILRGLIIAVMVAQFFDHNYENVFLCVLSLGLMLLPNLIEMNFEVDLPNAMEIIIMLFIFSAEILGEIHEYYIIFPFWDTMLHTINGFLAAAIGFSLVDLLNRHEKVTFKASPFFMAMVAFCFSMSIGVVWEFFEFGMDSFFGLDMQKDTVIYSISSTALDPLGGNTPYQIKDIEQVLVDENPLMEKGYLDIGLIDTMKDLIVNFIGAIVFSIIGYFYVKRKGKDGWTKNFIVRSTHKRKRKKGR